MGTNVVQGARWCGQPDAGGAWGYGETPKPGLGRGRERRASVCGGGADKIAAASQAALGEAEQSFAGAKTT